MALEVAESLQSEKPQLLIYGIGKNGLVVAKQLSYFLTPHIADLQILEVKIDKAQPQHASIPQAVEYHEGKNVLLVDDVINSGRTLCYALMPLLQLRPARIQTLVLVERMHKLFPVKPDFVGVKLATSEDDFIVVETDERIVTSAFLR